MEHLSIPELQAFRAGALSPANLLACDEHLSACSGCRAALAEASDADRNITSLMESFTASAAAHLSYEQIRLLAEGKLVAHEGREHAATCGRCAAEIDDLKLFAGEISALPRAGRHGSRTWAYGAVAAALLIAVLGAGVHYLRANRSHESAKAMSGQNMQADVQLPAEYQALIAQTTASGRLPIPDSATGEKQDETLLDNQLAPAAFRLLAPVNVVVFQDQPVLSWQPMNGAMTYTVAIYDSSYHKVAESDVLRATTWQPKSALSRGVLYSWTVTAHTAHSSVRSPVPPQAEVHFRVMNLAAAQQLQEAQASYPDNHLLLAALFAREGDLISAQEQLNGMAAQDPDSGLVHRLQNSLSQRYGSPSNTNPAQ